MATSYGYPHEIRSVLTNVAATLDEYDPLPTVNGAFRTNGLQPVSVRIYLKSAAELSDLAKMSDGKLIATAINRTGETACHQGWSKAIEALGGTRISCEDNQSKQQKSFQQAHAQSLQQRSTSAMLSRPERKLSISDPA